MPEDFNKVKIPYNDLSVRVCNALNINNIVYMDQLLNLTSKELLKLDNFGQKSLNEIRFFLRDKGLALKDEYNGISPIFLGNISEAIEKIVRESDEAIEKLNFLSFKLDVINIKLKRLHELNLSNSKLNENQ